jgi:hypothetical protein
MNKIKAIEMYIAGYNLEQISTLTKLNPVTVVRACLEYYKTGFVTEESKSNHWQKSPNPARFLMFRGREFESVTEFAKYLTENYGCNYQRVKSRIHKGATPEECLLPEYEYRKRKK